ncbi:MAG: tetratricopeptide repeat protein [Spirosoma sp.]|uniref:tetratricopeptide repeat protein n=1 Tax=Spirosoma sp. TaxID=1899569 RepID=UPI001AC4B784|nr:tetratricopeptide repeat protein [Spirosoma sp.]MBN8820510.1 tetratricopeptide repeat protein [Spirosoma sp.]
MYSPNSWLTTHEKAVIGALFVAYFFFNLFNFDCLLTLQTIFIVFAFLDLNQSDQPLIQIKPTLLFLIRITVVALLTFIGIYSVYQPYHSLRLLDQQNKITDIQQRVDALEVIYRQATGRQLDMADNLVSLTLSVLQSNQPLPAKQFSYQRATALMEEQLAIHPAYTRLMTRLVALYVAGGEIDKAISLAKHINAIEGSKRPPALIQLGNAYLNKRDFPQALSSFEQAHQLFPSWEEPVLYKAFTYAIQQDTTQCFPILRTISTQTLSNRLGFVKQIYYQSGYPREFLTRLMATKHKDLYPPSVYVEWALSAFDLHDRTQTYNAINSYYYMYLIQRFTYAEIKQLLEETDRGIRPDRLTSMTEALAH